MTGTEVEKLRKRFKAWQEDDKAGYDRLIELACDMDEMLGKSESVISAVLTLVEMLRERTWLSPVSADEMNRRDRWLADKLEEATREKFVQLIAPEG